MCLMMKGSLTLDDLVGAIASDTETGQFKRNYGTIPGLSKFKNQD